MKPLQIEVLKLLSSNEIADDDLLKIKKLIINSLKKNIDEEVDSTFKKRRWGKKKIEAWSKLHHRTPYK